MSKALKKFNRALLYIIVSIFIGNLFVGAILNNTPLKAKAQETPNLPKCELKQIGEIQANPLGGYNVTLQWKCPVDFNSYKITYWDDRGENPISYPTLPDLTKGPIRAELHPEGTRSFRFELIVFEWGQAVANSALTITPPSGCQGGGDEIDRAKQRVDTIEAAANTINPDDPSSVYSAVAEAYVFKKGFLAEYCRIGNAMDPNFAKPGEYPQINEGIKTQIVRYQKIINEKIEPAQENIKNMQYLKDFNTGEITDLPAKPPKGWAPESYRKGIDDLIKTRYPPRAITDKMNDFVDAIAAGNSDALKGQAGVVKANIATRWVAVVQGAFSLFTFNPAGLGQAVIGNMAADWNTQLMGEKISQEVKNNLNEAMNALITQSQGAGEDGNGYEVGLYSFYDLYLKAYGVATNITNPPGSDANAACKKALFGDAPIWNPSSWFQDAICEIMNLVSTVLVGILNWSLDLLKQVSIVPSLDNKYFLATSNFNLFFTEKAYAAIGPSLQANTGKAYIITSWKWMLGLVNIVIIIALLIIAFSNILRINIDTYIIKKSLPGLVLGVLLANFSLLIARMIVEFSDLLVYTLGSNIQLDPNSDLYRAIGIKGLAGGTAVTIAGLVSIIGGLAILGPVGGVAGGCLALLIALLPTVATTLLALMLYVRVAVIYFLVIISPLAFIMLALPNTSVYFKKWWSLFITWVLLAPAVWFILWIIAKIGGAGGGNTATGFLISIALLYFALILPFKWGGAIMATWAKIGKVLSRAPAKGVGAVGGMMSRGEGWVKPVGKFLNKASMAMDIPLAWSTTKKAWSTLEEDRVAVAQREAVGSIGFRRINPDATRTSIFRRMGDFEKFDTDTLVNFAGIEVDNNGNVVSNKYDSLDKMGNIKSGDEFHKVVGATGAMLKKLRYLRSTPAYARGDRDTIAEAQLLYNALTSGSLPLAGLAEKGNTTGWGTIMPVGPAPRGGWDLTPAALNASIFTPTISSNPAAPLQRLDPETGQMVRYGQYDNDPNSDTYGEMQIDFNASKKAWGQVAPELGEADAHKVTGFVHAHEAFHDIAANKLSPEARARLTREQEEQLADAYARQALNLGDEETKARDRKALDDFKAQMPEDSRGLMDLKYEGEGDNNLLLGLHRAGLEYGKISNTRLSETPTHAGLGLDRPAPAAGSAPALTKEEQEEEVRKNAYIGGIREEYHRETEKIIEKAPEDAAGSKLLDGDQTLRVARLITGRLTVRPNEEQRYNHALYESSLQGAKGAEQKLRVALEQPAVGASKAKVEGIVQTVRTTPAAQLSQKLQTEYQITPEIQARLKPDIQGFTDAVNFKNVVSHRLANEALDITQPMRANLTARLQKGDIDWTGLDRIQSELKTQEQKLSLGRVAPAELDTAYKTLVRIHPAAQIQVEGAKSQPEILSKIKQSRAAIGQLSTPEIRRAMESGGSTQQVEAKIRQNYQAKFEVQHNLDQINKAMSDAVRSVRISRPNLTNEQVSMDLERRVTENVRIKDLIERVTKVDPVYKETVVSGVARKIAPQYAKNPSYKIDAGAISQISNQELRRVASAPRPAPRVSIARPASQPIAKPMNDIRPIPEKPSPSQWETQKVESIIATRK